MKKSSIRFSAVFLLLALLWTTLPACCPSGVWKDNFNAVYNLITLYPSDRSLPNQVTGTVDTRDAGCGVWNVRPPEPGEPYDPTKDVIFVGVNPSPNPADNCCYRYLFQGISDFSCLTIIGEFETIGGKCNEQGDMYLEVVQ